jgi:L-ascorbate metabolism protein UlaG (beta-lactamase superfamily)
VHLQFGEASLFIDPLAEDVWEKSLPDTMVPIAPSAENYVLITHRHPDHCNPKAIHAALGSSGTLVYGASAGPPPVDGVRLRAAALYEPQILGDFTATAVPAVDGYGDPQVSWVITVPGCRVIHCGDTLWHGSWWHIGRQFGPFDAAFLPINGARFAWRQPVSDVPAVLTPEQAVAAAVILGAKRLIPIHFGVIGAEGYAEVDKPLARLENEARRRGITVRVMRPAEWLDLG